MGRRHRWDPNLVAQVVQKAEQLDLSYIDAAERFGIPVWRIYRYNHALNQESSSSPSGDACLPREIACHVSQGEPVGSSGEIPSCQDALNGTTDSSPKTDVPLPDGKTSQAANPEKACLERSRKELAQANSVPAVSSSLPDEVQQLIVDYKRENPDCGFKRIEQHLRNSHFLLVPRKRIRQVLKDTGLLGLNDSSFDRNGNACSEPKGSRRFEASAPGELYQMDITYVYITGLSVLYLVDVIDDHSRFCLRSVLRTDQSADTLIDVLHDAIVEYGKPKKLLTDEGSAFYSWSTEKNKFQQYLDDQRIEHIVADPHSPTTTGKVERFHQTIKNELIRKVKFKDYGDAVTRIKAYVHHYNYERPHQALGGARPADRFMGVNGGRTLAHEKLVAKEPDRGKGYLLFKLDAYEVSIVLKAEHAPELYVNGVLFLPQNAGNPSPQTGKEMS